jgi:hypothetical protein
MFFGKYLSILSLAKVRRNEETVKQEGVKRMKKGMILRIVAAVAAVVLFLPI